MRGRPGKANPVTRIERALADTEAELSRRAAARITRYLTTRTDLSDGCRELARQQRDEYLQIVSMIEGAIAIEDPAPTPAEREQWSFADAVLSAAFGDVMPRREASP